jgi:hypothetical protein
VVNDMGTREDLLGYVDVVMRNAFMRRVSIEMG